MAVTKYLLLLIIHVFALKVYGKFTCEIQDDDYVIDCGNYNATDFVLQRGLLSPYSNIRTLLLNICHIQHIETDVFEEVPLLERLDLSENQIENLTIGTFDALTELEELNLSDNYITYLPVDIFKFNVKLKKLDLGYNAMFQLNLGVFDSLLNLTILVLSKNLIIGNYWNPEVFRRNINVETIQFSGNDMSEAPQNLLSHFDQLNSVSLRKCHLTEFPTFLISSNITSIIHLNLRQNKIGIIKTNFFENFEILAILDLSRNQIEHIAENSFKSMKELVVLNLSKNLLTTLPNGLFETTYKLSLLDLSHNMITVLQEDLFKETNLMELSVAHNKLTYLQENFSQQQKNSGVILKVFFFDFNPWQCACLKHLLDEVKGLRIQYKTKYFDGDQSVCVTTKEFLCKRQDINNFHEDFYNSTLNYSLLAFARV